MDIAKKCIGLVIAGSWDDFATEPGLSSVTYTPAAAPGRRNTKRVNYYNLARTAVTKAEFAAFVKSKWGLKKAPTVAVKSPGVYTVEMPS